MVRLQGILKREVFWLHAFWGIFLLGAVFFYKERILNYDTSFYLFKIIYFDGFNIESNRITIVLTQVLPLIAYKLGMPMKAIMIAYSLNFALLYYGIFCVLYHGIRSRSGGYLLIVSLIWGVLHNFFYIVTETHQAVAYGVLFYGLVFHEAWEKKRPILYFASVFIAGFLTYFSHPVGFLLLGFVVLWKVLLETKVLSWQKMLFLAIVVISMPILKSFIVSHNAYEGSFFANLTKWHEILPALHQKYIFKYLLNKILTTYLVVLIVGVISVYGLYRSGQRLALAGYVGYVIVFILLTLVLYHEEGAEHGAEKDYMPLVFIVAMPFFHDMKESRIPWQLRQRIWAIGTLFSILLIAFGSRFYAKKLHYLNDLISQAKATKKYKWIMRYEDYDVSRGNVHWPLATETLLFSAMKDPNECVTYYLMFNEQELKDIDLNHPNTLMVVNFWTLFDASQLPKKYFHLTGAYHWHGEAYEHELVCQEAKERNATQALLVTPSQPYGCTQTISLDKPRVVMSVWVKGEVKNCYVVAQNEDPKRFYLASNQVASIDGEWTLLSDTIVIPKEIMTSPLKVYFWNAGKDSVHIQDFRLKY